ncbi:hypothetical protein Psi02_76190 [Planotetraspora silvatica]|uniref:HAD family hydrolase n=1 Tax=Planotetraspora silvatica TaxID=234614 RepID=A0A8J3V733_9ACTN|nr:hypothetical protein [Planotetraspora silvatica]GII51195.1 hypothetical protein Psi02_76190 [Planotetraspora silvatica]
MQRLALFDLDNTLIDLDAAFVLWAEKFADRGLGLEGVDWLLNLNRDGLPHRELFFHAVRERFRLSDSVEDLWTAYRRRMIALAERQRVHGLGEPEDQLRSSRHLSCIPAG